MCSFFKIIWKIKEIYSISAFTLLK
uniref:Uncharacterized protein n=1 Tax=Lepeophtheirus salmonis TaxID=72036 RepID=A0A0K2VC82_LEPSM